MMSTPIDVRKSVARARSSAETLAQSLKELEGMLSIPTPWMLDVFSSGPRSRKFNSSEVARL